MIGTNFRTFVLALACSTAISIAASAADAKRVDVPAGDLIVALETLAKQSGVELIYQTEQLKGLRTKGVHGTLTPQDAARKLLEDTPLMLRVDDSGAMLIGKPAAAGGRGGVQRAAATPSVAAEPSSPLAPRTAEEIVVTAQKRSERLIDAPQAVTVLRGSDLEKLGAVQFRDFADSVPGLSFNTAGAGYSQIVLRGVTTGVDPSPTVGVYVDEVPYGASTGFARGGQLALDAGLFDMERIEVLRGPQGTLYGAATMGGLLKYVTREPDLNAIGGSVRAGLSGTNEGGINYDVAGSVNAPITADKAAIRASAFHSHDGGYVDNVTRGRSDVDRSNIYGGRADFLFKPTDALSVRLTGFAQNVARDGFPLVDYNQNGTPVDGDLTQRRQFDERFTQRFRLGSATVNYDFGPASLTSISSYQTSNSHVLEDYPVLQPSLQSLGFSAVALQIDTNTDKFTQEVRLASSANKTVEWLVGGFYTRETSGDLSQLQLRNLAGQPATNTVITVSTPTRYQEYAAFGDLTWHVIDKLDLTGGIRYAKNEQKWEQIGSGLLGVSAPQSSSSEGVFTYLANLRYHFTDTSIGYLRYATGYRPGGPNPAIRDATTGIYTPTPAVEADRLKSYEIGYKLQSRDRSFDIDLAAYYIDWSNIQAFVNRSGFGVAINAPGGATVKGAEATIGFRPVENLHLRIGGVYQDARLSEATPALLARKDERLPSVPRYTAQASADYVFSSQPWNPTAGFTLRYVADRWTTFGVPPNTPRPQFHLPEYTVVDLHGGFALGDVDVQLFARNLFDERAQLATPTISVFPRTGPLGISTLQPRTIGASVSAKF